MQIIRDKATQIVKYANVTLLPDHVEGDGFIDYTTTPTNAETVEVDSLPIYFVGGAWRYDGAWTVVDQDQVDRYRQSITPSEITNWQAKKQLLIEGVYDQVNVAISTMDAAAQIDWNHATVFRRDYPLIQQMQTMLGRTDADTDEYFIAASKLQ